MCGIIGYFGSETIKLHGLFDALAELETAQLEREKSPVGGHGAGIVIFDKKREVIKLGKTNGSPVQLLREKIKDGETRQVFVHVRRASKQFEGTVRFAECTQPYHVKGDNDIEIFSAHNGYFEEYIDIRKKIGPRHVFESEKVRLIDSEVILHYFEQLYLEKRKFTEAARILFNALSGDGNAIALLLHTKTGLQLALLYKGKARGLYVWENDTGDVFFSSRREVIERNFASMLEKNCFTLIKAIAPGVADDFIKACDLRHLTLP